MTGAHASSTESMTAAGVQGREWTTCVAVPVVLSKRVSTWGDIRASRCGRISITDVSPKDRGIVPGGPARRADAASCDKSCFATTGRLRYVRLGQKALLRRPLVRTRQNAMT